MGNKTKHLLKYPYSARRVEINGFVATNSSVRAFLGKFSKGKNQPYSTYNNYARVLCMFFKWLRIVKHIDLSPEAFIIHVARSKISVNPLERLWGRELLLEFSRDNPDFAEKGSVLKYHCFSTVKLFCDYHETPLTSAGGVFGRHDGRKHDESPFTVEKALRVLSVLSERDRAICMTLMQSGQSIKQILVQVNGMASYVFREIDAGKQRIRLDFNERKGNSFPYFSYISLDAIQEIQKWRPIRQSWLDAQGKESEWLFITDKCTPVLTNCFEGQFREVLRRHGLWTGPYSVRLHQFRQFFEGEASPPDRGISKHYISFMMGHKTEPGLNSNDVVGGVYDKRPRFDPRTVENEFAKLERWINIYSSQAIGSMGLRDEFWELMTRPEVKSWILRKAQEDGLF